MKLTLAVFASLVLLTLATVVHPSTGAPIAATTTTTSSTTTPTTMATATSTTTTTTTTTTATTTTATTTTATTTTATTTTATTNTTTTTTTTATTTTATTTTATTTTTTATTNTTTNTNTNTTSNALPQTRILSNARAQRLARRLAAVNGCNANVCFAIDGSSSIPPPEFTMEKNFVLDMSAIISVDSSVEMAAVQYATANWPINRLTVDAEQFNLNVADSEQAGGHSFVTGGLNYCFAQLWRRPFEANKIILLGDGIETIGSRAAHRANLFRKIGGDISVVAAGSANFTALKEIVGGNERRIFNVGNFFDSLELELIIEELVQDVCGIAPL